MVRLRRPSSGLGLSGGSADCFVSSGCGEASRCPGAEKNCGAEVVSGNTEVVTLREIIKLVHKKGCRIYFAMIIRPSFQLVKLDRVSVSVHIGLMLVPSIARIGLIIGLVAFVRNFLSVTAVR